MINEGCSTSLLVTVLSLRTWHSKWMLKSVSSNNSLPAYDYVFEKLPVAVSTTNFCNTFFHELLTCNSAMHTKQKSNTSTSCYSYLIHMLVLIFFYYNLSIYATISYYRCYNRFFYIFNQNTKAYTYKKQTLRMPLINVWCHIVIDAYNFYIFNMWVKSRLIC